MSDEEVLPVAHLPIKRRRSSLSNWDCCIFCQKIDGTLYTGTANGIERVKEAFAIRKRSNDSVYSDILERLDSDIDCIESKHPKWHSITCYALFCSKTKLLRIEGQANREQEKDNVSNAAASATTSRLPAPYPSRSEVPTVQWDKCIFCQKRSNIRSKRILHQVLTKNVEETIICTADFDETLKCKIAGLDLIAYEAKYHLPCLLKWQREYGTSLEKCKSQNVYTDAFKKLLSELDCGFAQGHIYTLNSINNRYCQLLSKAASGETPYPPQRLKDKLVQHYGEEIQFVQQLDKTLSLLVFPASTTVETALQALKRSADDVRNIDVEDEILTTGIPNEDETFMSALCQVTTRIKSDLDSVSGHSGYEGIDEAHALDVVPNSLYLLLRMMFSSCHDKDTETHENQTQRTHILSIAQDIVYATSKGKKLTPKHIGIGLAVHQATRSKALLQLLHASGHCISYEKVQRIDTSIAQHQLERFCANDNTPVPDNLVPLRFVQFAADNIDILEETLDGKGTFHGTQMAVFQRGPASKVVHEQSDISQARVLSSMPEEFHHIQSSGCHGQKPPVHFSEPIQDHYFQEIEGDVDDAAHALDNVWLMCRAHSREQTEQKLPAWTAFNQQIAVSTDAITTVGYLPIIPAPASDYDTMWTVIQRCKKIAYTLGQQSTVLTLDEGLYCKARELAWLHSDECKNLVLRLGGFHITMNFMKAIGQHFQDGGLSDVLIESGVYNEVTVNNILNGKSWNRAVRSHKLTMEALWGIFWRRFQSWLNDKNIPFDEDIVELSECIINAFSDDSQDIRSSVDELIKETKTMKPQIAQFEAEMLVNPTSKYWMQYIEMVQVLLDFIRAEREGSWSLHVSSFTKMLPWMAVYDHGNYFRWGCIYLIDMQQLELTSPDVFEEFKAGNFVVKSTEKHFNQISTDQALEHVNKLGKIAGGLVGITRTDTARERWCLTYNDRARLAADTRQMLGIDKEDDGEHVETGLRRIRKDEEDVELISRQFEQFQVFEHQGPDLVCISSNDVAPEDVKTDLMNAKANGQVLVEEFVANRIKEGDGSTKFFDRIPKRNSKTFTSMKKKSPVSASKTTKQAFLKSDRDVFQRIVVAAEGGRKIDLAKLLKYELTPVPLSLGNPDGTLRKADKAVLGSILDDGHSVPELPEPCDLPTCCIIDGMALVQSIGKPQGSTTFGDLAAVFTKAVLGHFSQNCTRIDVVFDHYRQDSIKAGTREHRSATHHRPIRRKVDGPKVPLPKQWNAFIDLPENKRDLVDFLSKYLIEICQSTLPENQLLITAGGFHDIEKAEASHGQLSESLHSNHEEADTRLVLHAVDAVKSGYGRLLVYSRDTDVLVLLVHFYPDLLVEELWMCAGTRKKPKFMPVHDISLSLSQDVREALPGFHSLTGCDTTSSLAGHGKKTCWKAFKRNPSLLSDIGVGTLVNDTLSMAEEFVVQVYSPLSKLTSVDALRVNLFRSKPPESLPPTHDAFVQHAHRAHYQAMIWRKATEPKPKLPSALDNGWRLGSTGMLEPLIMCQTSVPKIYTELLQCKCTTQCRRATCTCTKNQMMCIRACKCYGGTCCNPFTVTDGTESN